MTYVDGFLLAVPRAKLDSYRKLAELGGSVWMEHGAHCPMSSAPATMYPTGNSHRFHAPSMPGRMKS